MTPQEIDIMIKSALQIGNATAKKFENQLFES